MPDRTPPLSCFASTAPGLEMLARDELRALGIVHAKVEPGGVAFQADRGGLYRANLWLRTASRVLVRLASFRAEAFYELELAARRVPFERVLRRGAPVKLSVTCHKSRLYHSKAVAQRVLEAIEKRVGAPASARLLKGIDGESEDESPGDALVLVRFFRDLCTISADSSGELLHRRGYRQEAGRAPLRESLAAAILLACGYRAEEPFVDPMCGSGTIPIEAALLARRIAPGSRRHFAFEQWPEHDATIWRALREEALAQERPAAPAPILGSDVDAHAVQLAAANAARAGVQADVQLSARPFTDVDLPRAPGLIAANPPYGVRLGGPALRGLYSSLGDTLARRAQGWRVALLAPQRAAWRATGQAWETCLRTRNGGIPVELRVSSLGHDNEPVQP